MLPARRFELRGNCFALYPTKHQVIYNIAAPPTSQIYLRMTVKDGSRFQFAFSETGNDWKSCGNDMEVSLEAVRITLTANGSDAVGRFAWLRVVTLPNELTLRGLEGMTISGN